MPRRPFTTTSTLRPSPVRFLSFTVTATRRSKKSADIAARADEHHHVHEIEEVERKREVDRHSAPFFLPRFFAVSNARLIFASALRCAPLQFTTSSTTSSRFLVSCRDVLAEAAEAHFATAAYCGGAALTRASH